MFQDLTISGSNNISILLDAETILKRVQHKVQHDTYSINAICDTVSCGGGFTLLD